MQGDEPTIPSLHSYGSEDTGAAPSWPLVEQRLPPSPPSAKLDLRTALLGVSVGANVVLLLGLLGVLALAHAGFFTPGGASPAPFTSIQESSTTGNVDQTESTTWLQVAPTTVQMGCGDGQQTQSVVLTNRGTQPVDWQANIAGPQGRAAVELSPDHGQLQAGASSTVQVQIHRHSTGQQGVIHFTVSPAAAGSPPTLSYATQSCD